MPENEEIRNDDLLEAIKDMRKEFNTQSQSKVINIALRATYLVPAIVDQNTHLVADNDNHLRFEDKPQARFMLVKNKTNRNFFPVFTDKEEFDKMQNDKGFNAVKMKFADVATLTEQSASTVAGFVINPMSTNLPFTQEMLASIKQTLADARQKREAEQAAAQAENQGITVTQNPAPEE